MCQLVLLRKLKKSLLKWPGKVTHPLCVRGRTKEYLPTIGWQMFRANWQEGVQWVFKILSGLLGSSISPEKKNHAICLIYGMIMFSRCHELNRKQTVNSVLLTQGQASVNVSFKSYHVYFIYIYI